MRTLLVVAPWLLPLLCLQPAGCGQGRSHARPRLQLSHSELQRGRGLLWEGGANGALLLDEDQGWLLAGGRDHVHLLRPDSLEQPISTVHWPAAAEQVERCLLAGKNLESECANFVRLLQPFNQTHIYACATGAFYPQCTFLHLDLSTKEPSLSLSDVVESGRGKCPFSPSEPFTALLTGGELFAGTSVDFMGANAAVFRTTLGGRGSSSSSSSSSSQHYIRSEAYDHNWLNEPEFVASFSVPDSLSSDDDKVYFFFREWAAVEEGAGPWDRKLYARVARVCKKDSGGRRSLIHRWTTFLKVQLVCSLPAGPAGLDTHFNHLEDVFLLETRDPLNPTFHALFTTSSSVFRGSAVCVFSMSALRAAFNGPFAHRESPHHRWVEFKGHVPYPRPGACPSETYDPLHTSTRDLPDQVVSFMRQHQLMWEPVLPLGGRPLLTRLAVEREGDNGAALLTRLVVDRVEAEDGVYDVLHLGTEDGKVLKAVVVTLEGQQTEEILLEELAVFPRASPILSMKLSTKRQLFVSSEVGVAQVALQRCELYGADCAHCGLARDPYCSWDGQTCSRFFPSNKRRARRQDVMYGAPWSQCPVTQDDVDSAPVKLAYGVEGNATFLECEAGWPQAHIQWTLQGDAGVHTTVPQTDESRVLHTRRGLLVQRLQAADAGLYTCAGHEHSYRQVLARYRLHVLPGHSLLRPGKAPPPRRYKDLNAVAAAAAVTSDLPGLGQYCEQLWYQHEKRRQQKLKLKLKLSKQEDKKARVRRNDPAL
ncbi:semaphorin-3D isoform X2 [Nelusetta ayraudi]|uniref:semaphorin-3D isoform X2 n=1 Tax=Nelusetta ayraudi TaxID=303726 RepID=UPI003F6F0462